jgi:hypothetical protein
LPEANSIGIHIVEIFWQLVAVKGVNPVSGHLQGGDQVIGDRAASLGDIFAVDSDRTTVKLVVIQPLSDLKQGIVAAVTNRINNAFNDGSDIPWIAAPSINQVRDGDVKIMFFITYFTRHWPPPENAKSNHLPPLDWFSTPPD